MSPVTRALLRALAFDVGGVRAALEAWRAAGLAKSMGTP